MMELSVFDSLGSLIFWTSHPWGGKKYVKGTGGHKLKDHCDEKTSRYEEGRERLEAAWYMGFIEEYACFTSKVV